MQENADPDLRHDLERLLAGMAPEEPAPYRHTAEGPDDMPAHIKTAVTRTRLGITAGWRSASGRASSPSSTATRRSAARSRCI